MVKHSIGEGGYSGDGGAGKVDSALAGVYPCAAADLSAGLRAWAAAELGEGTLTLTPESPETGAILHTLEPFPTSSPTRADRRPWANRRIGAAKENKSATASFTAVSPRGGDCPVRPGHGPVEREETTCH